MHKPTIEKTPARTLTKSALCRIFGLYSRRSGKCYYEKLRETYFTNDALEKMGITQQEYEKRVGGKPFTFEQSERIIAHFRITREELTDI